MFVKLKMTKTMYYSFYLLFRRESLKEPSIFPQCSLSFQSKKGHQGLTYAEMGFCSEFVTLFEDVISLSLMQFHSHCDILKYVNSISLYMESSQCLPWLVVLNVERPFFLSLLLSI